MRKLELTSGQTPTKILELIAAKPILWEEIIVPSGNLALDAAVKLQAAVIQTKK